MAYTESFCGGKGGGGGITLNYKYELGCILSIAIGLPLSTSSAPSEKFEKRGKLVEMCSRLNLV